MGCLHIVTIGYLLLLPLTNINGKEYYDKNFIAGMDKFAVELYSAIADKYEGDSIVFSPLSIQMCATMALMGAKGKTATELSRGLSFCSLDEDVLADMYNTFLKKYENSNIMKISNKIYLKDGLKGLKPFVDTVKNKFNSEVSNLDFVAGEDAVISINDWIESKTNHLIKDFIPFGVFQRTARIILLNVVHFKAKLMKVDKYPRSKKCERNNKKFFQYRVSGNFLHGTPLGSSIMLPHHNSNILRLTLLAQMRWKLSQIDNYIKSTTIKDIIKQLRKKSTGWFVSKSNTTVDMGLEEAFRKLGMKRIFKKREADFGAMLNVTESLKISQIIHRTNLKLNSEGTEVVAATAIQFHARCSGKYIDIKNPLCYDAFMTTYVHKTEGGDYIPIFMGRGA